MRQQLADDTVAALKEAGIDFVSFLPESRLIEILTPLQQDEQFTLVRASHEGSAVAIASGAALVGKRSAAYMEATGVSVSMYTLQAIPMRLGIPLVLIVAYVGSPGDKGNNMTFSGYGSRFERIIQALGLQYQVFEDDHRLGTRINDLVRAAHSAKQPALMLFTGEFTDSRVH